MFCPNCGKPVPDGAKFCGECGCSVPAQSGGERPDTGGKKPGKKPGKHKKQRHRWLLALIPVVLVLALLIGLGAWMLLRDMNSQDSASADDSLDASDTADSLSSDTYNAADEDAEIVDYVSCVLSVGYARGDRADYVTEDLELPTEIDNIDVEISWSSSSDAITSSGVVTRPADTDEQVVLTASITSGDITESREWTLTVVHTSSIDINTLPDYSAMDLEELNAGNEDFYIFRSDDLTRVTTISGQFSEYPVENAEDALAAVQSVHTLIGLSDAYEELSYVSGGGDAYSTEYQFQQMYGGYAVYGRLLTVSADSEGISSYLNAGVLPSSILDTADAAILLSVSEAAVAILASCGEECAVDSESMELVWYSLGDYETDPVLVYMASVSGVSAAGAAVSEQVFVSAADGTVIDTVSNEVDASQRTGSGTNELGEAVSFPVTFSLWDYYFYYMQDLDRDITMYNNNLLDDTMWVYSVLSNQLTEGIDIRIGSEINYWSDETAISAYTNLITVYDWYQDALGRNSVDGNGLALKIIVHGYVTDYNSSDRVYLKENNASWNCSEKTITFFDNSSDADLSTTTAACLDVAAHEYTHGVLYYKATGGTFSMNTGICRAINEAYADIFACLIDENWTMGENWQTLRSMEDPLSTDTPCADKMSSIYYDEDDAYACSTVISHAAYLMTEYGLSTDMLAQLWYKSMGYGYDSTSTFLTVRRNVLQAASAMGLSDRNIGIIEQAFDDVEIYDEQYCTVKISISDSDGKPVSTADVLVRDAEGSPLEATQDTDSSGNMIWELILAPGNYTLEITADGYEDYSEEITVSADNISKTITIMKDSQSEEVEESAAEELESDNDASVEQIPSDAVEYNGHYYYLYDLDTVNDADEAIKWCSAQGGYLATITSEEENDFLYDYILSLGYKSAYFGLTDSTSEGEWIWLNGEAVAWTNWHSGEPNAENTAEDYAMFYYKYTDGTWNDGDFGSRTVNGGTAFLCEWDNETVTVDWASTYLDYLAPMTPGEFIGVDVWELDGTNYTGFDIIYLNDDDIPELIMYGSSMAAGMLLLTVDSSGNVNTASLIRHGLCYEERQNVLDNATGSSNYYCDVIYCIEDGQWVCLGEGWYRTDLDENDDWVYYNCTWDGASVTEEEYHALVASFIDLEEAQSPSETSYSLDELLEWLEAQN